MIKKGRKGGAKKASTKAAAPLNLRARKHPAPQKSSRMARSLVLLMPPEGGPLFVETLRIESDERVIKVSLLPADPRQSAALGALRRTVRGQSIPMAYRTTALWVRVIEVKQLVERGREIWNLEFQPDENANSRGYGIMEMNFNNYSADEIAEMRARRILLDEKIPTPSAQNSWHRISLDGGMLDRTVEGSYGSRIQIKGSPFPALFSAFKNNPGGFTAAAKLYAVMQLLLSNAVGSVHSLDLKMKGRDKLSVKFEGERPPRYSNQPPQVIKVEGVCELTRRG